MRILRLDLGPARLELHPYVSVVRELDDSTRRRLVDALAGLVTGAVQQAGGLVEAHGVLLDLDGPTLELLDLTAVRDIDVVVRAEQLPGAALGPAARKRADLELRRGELAERARAAEHELERARLAAVAASDALRAVDDHAAPAPVEPPRDLLDARLAARAAAEEALAAAQRALAQAEVDHQQAVDRREAAQREREELLAKATAAAAELDVARASRDPFASAAVEAARDRVREVEGELADLDEDDVDLAPATGDGDPAARIDELVAQRQLLEATLLSMDVVDPYRVEAALASADEPGREAPLAPVEDAQALADEWDALDARLRRGGGDRATTETLVAARRRLDAARVAVFEAERAVRLPDVSRADAEALEEAHEAVLRAQDRSERRLTGGRARVKLDEARQHEQHILDRLGFLTYADFVMGTSILNVDVEKERALDEARAALDAAEREVAELEAGVDAELALAEGREQLRALRARAVELLGRDPGADVSWALRQLRAPAAARSPRVQRLQRALEDVGVVLDEEDATPELLNDLAKVWLDEQRGVAAQRERVEGELAATDAELAALQAATADRESASRSTSERRRRLTARLEEARAALVGAEQRVERHRAAEDEVDAARATLDEVARQEERVAGSLTNLEHAEVLAAATVRERQHALDQARAALDDAGAAVAEVEAELDALRQQLASAAGEGGRLGAEAAAAEAEQRLADASAALESQRSALADVEGELGALPAPADGEGAAPSAEELEWYLLSRLAAQRSVSYAGSVPLVLDDALHGIPPDSLTHLLERLERMASAVQVVIVTDDPAVTAWADLVGPERAALVEPARAG